MNKATVLIIDDEAAIRKMLAIALESNDYKITMAENAKEGIKLAANHPPDLILLDIGLPDKSGHEVLKELRLWYSHAIIILSAQNSEEDIVTALDNGATDYLTKPFRTAELLARMRSAIKRNDTNTNENSIQFGDIAIDFAARTVKQQHEIIKLTLTEFNLLSLLVKNEGRVLTHQYILKAIWGNSYSNETQYLRVFIKNLRKKIETENTPSHIVTENGIGYRFQF